MSWWIKTVKTHTYAHASYIYTHTYNKANAWLIKQKTIALADTLLDDPSQGIGSERKDVPFWTSFTLSF